LGTVQTLKVNSFFALIPQIARLLKKIINGDLLKSEQISALVTPAGLFSMFLWAPNSENKAQIVTQFWLYLFYGLVGNKNTPFVTRVCYPD
jgi:hypothetical protein